ncbi:MAG: ComEC/Rec2 family competence protein [Sphingomonadales bacterium]|nr:ComEC/Rec2 family competence protein [Sphingomonadales bacterium]MDE2169970.1 ComEC/Rec2 family competence protein [Sphingomonadales bacterium]
MASQSGNTTTQHPVAKVRCRALLAAALQQGHRTSVARLSSIALRLEQFLNDAGPDRLPWLAVGFASGIGLWFALANSCLWSGVIVFGLAVAGGALATARGQGRFDHLRLAVAAMALSISAGCAVVWMKSALVGTPAISAPVSAEVTARVLHRYARPAQHKVTLQLALTEPGERRAVRADVTVTDDLDRADIREGAVIRLRMRLMPPGAPLVPGGYDAARQAWFDGVAASGFALGPVHLVSPSRDDQWLAYLRRALSEHVRARVPGAAGGLAAAFASGDRGGIPLADEQAMRDSGLTHLLSVSGLHVGAVIAGAYVLAFRILALFPFIALRVRVPLLASCVGGLVGIGYSLLTGAQVPTMRSVFGAMLALGAVALGRRALSMRLLAISAFFVMLMWPESVVGPSFQMSFGSVLALITLHESGPVQAFMAPRGERWWRRWGRHLVMLLLTGMVIDLALMPIALLHFHRAGIYGALANMLAIPLTTFVSMPAIALGLLLDLVGMGGPAWWICGQSLHALLTIAHGFADRSASVVLMPSVSAWRFVAVAGGLIWLALIRGNVRLWGILPAALAVLSLAWVKAPDLIIAGDGRTIAITREAGAAMLILHAGQSTYQRKVMSESAGLDDRTAGSLDGGGSVTAMTRWPGATCTGKACALVIERGGRLWHILMLRGVQQQDGEDLARACAQSDIVIAPMPVERSCTAQRLTLDQSRLSYTGGVMIDLARGSVTTVSQGEGQHPWWRPSP